MRFIKYFIVLLLLYSCSSSDNKQENLKKEQAAIEERWKEISKSPPKYEYKIVANKGGINIRSGPGTNFEIDPSGQLVKGETLYILEEKDGWIKFRVTPKHVGWSGWILKRLLAEKNDCRKYVKLLSVDFWAKETGQRRSYILTKFKINTFRNESTNRVGHYVGELIPGSKALIIKEGIDDYKIKSPYDGTIGWISKIQVEKTLYMNIKTLEPCTPN